MFENALWKSKSGGRRRAILMLACLVVLLPSLILLLVSASGSNKTLMVVACVLTVAAIVASAVILLLGRFTSLKWDVANLEFAAAENGLYFTSLAYQNSYFFAEWAEVASYSHVAKNNGLTTVTVNFTAPLDAGSFGKIKYMKMVGVSEFDKLQALFAEKEKPEVTVRGGDLS
ncbi:MAG: hypothetical protein NC184_06895 [Roseburia sp.]|nr:hypothetical protein [Roseburia sp.]